MRIATLALLGVMLLADSATGQLPKVRGYYLNVPTWSDSNLFTVGGVGNVNRFRLMTEPSYDDFSLQVAYEQVLSLSQRPTSGASGPVDDSTG